MVGWFGVPGNEPSLHRWTATFPKNSMLILWDHTWGHRLWCIFELAAYLKCHWDENDERVASSSQRWTWRRRSTAFEVERSLMILPVFWGRYVQLIFLACCIFMMNAVLISYDFVVWRMVTYAVVLLGLVVLTHWGIVGYFRELDALCLWNKKPPVERFFRSSKPEISKRNVRGVDWIWTCSWSFFIGVTLR